MQAVSYEYRRKAGNLLGEKTYNIFLIINGVIGTIVSVLLSGLSSRVTRLNWEK